MRSSIRRICFALALQCGVLGLLPARSASQVAPPPRIQIARDSVATGAPGYVSDSTTLTVTRIKPPIIVPRRRP